MHGISISSRRAQGSRHRECRPPNELLALHERMHERLTGSGLALARDLCEGRVASGELFAGAIFAAVFLPARPRAPPS